ncbi:PD-(D/E)XK nuclease family protein [Peribacillus castrilensis]|uniref:PDDEXK-like family protein n=1 Tax=Bacillaceae TaxID=186817 RepID=UPI000662936D|nr:PD-(D/E)XK nuclease family protein [Bacillus sp. 445_BSPC]
MTFSLEAIAQLDHSKEFARLHQKFHQFNPLKVLRVDQFEIRHSNVLAWLLDPNENHQLGSFFLKKLLSRLVTRNENEDKVEGIDFLTYLYASFSDAEVYREVKTETNRYIDLLVVVPSQKLVLVIENKFHAAESHGQLEDYLTYARNHYEENGYSIIPIFLTLTSDAPSFQDYWIMDYHDVLEIITLHIELHREAISDNVYEFLMNYTAVLQEELVQDEEGIQLALDVYQVNQTAIDVLYLSQHNEFRKQPRYRELFQQVDGFTNSHQEALKRIYEKKKQTINYIFKIGSNVLREAFLSFVQIEKIPQEVYKAHVQFPSFILPDWLDFAETIGEPEQGYWLGHGLIIWFERTWDERLKVNVEVGPVPFEKRLELLTAFESQGVSFRTSAKLEGKKYTKIYTQTTDISDWANKQEIVEKMERLYHDSDINSTFKKIALAVESMEIKEEKLEQIESVVHYAYSATGTIPGGAYIKFAENHGIKADHYRIQNRTASFLIPTFRELEQTYGETREKWWWHNSTFTFWFERLKDDRLKLTLELGPLQPDQRLAIIERLETLGVSFSAQSKLSTARYTRLFSKSKVITNWDDEEAISEEMEWLFSDPKNQDILSMIETLKVNPVNLVT